jgi:hypothetical protein
MRAKEFIKESSIASGVARAMPSTYVLPELRSQDAYTQYRFGMALASARAKAKGEVQDFTDESSFGENMVVVARSKEEEETLSMALSLYGKDNSKRLISTPKSQEPKDTQTKSPMVAAKRIQPKQS